MRLGIFALVSGVVGAGCSAPPRPNVLLVTLDTTRVDAVGAFGGKEAGTPTLDQLAARGTRFTRAYTVTPLTIPAHSSIFTGMFPPRHGVRDNGDFFLGDDAVTLAERLRAEGYATMASVGAEVTSHHWGFAQGFDAYYDDMGDAAADPNRWRVERRGDRVVDDALGWLAQNGKGERPWFAWVHLFDAHHPYEPPSPYDVMFEGRPYYGEVAFADSQVKRVLDAIDAMGLRERTFVVVTGDHGEGLGQHGEAMHGVLLYDPTTHIPMIVAGPGVKEDAAVDAPVSLVDITPTILGEVGAKPPVGLDGLDLGAVLRGEAPADAARAVYLESLYAFHHYGWAPQRALVTATHKLIDSSRPRLFAKEDAGERDDLAGRDATLRDALEQRERAMVEAMEPAGTAQSAALSAERVSQLEALGYLTATAGADPAATDLADPEERLPVLRQVEQARQAMQKGKDDEARARIDEAIAADPGLAETRMMKVMLLWRTGDVAGAYDEAVALDAAHPGSQVESVIATLLLLRGQVAEAATRAEAALALDPYLAPAWATRLHATYLLGDLPRLGAALADARVRLPDDPTVLGMRGVLEQLRGDPAAEGTLDAAIAIQPKQPFVHLARGTLYDRAGDVDRAEAEFEAEIGVLPPAVPARRELVRLYAGQKRYAEQLAQLDAILATGAGLPKDLHARAQALFNLQRYPEAKTAVDACLVAAPRHAGCTLLLANVLEKLGHHDEALAAFAEAKALVAAP